MKRLGAELIDPTAHLRHCASMRAPLNPSKRPFPGVSPVWAFCLVSFCGPYHWARSGS